MQNGKLPGGRHHKVV